MTHPLPFMNTRAFGPIVKNLALAAAAGVSLMGSSAFAEETPVQEARPEEAPAEQTPALPAAPEVPAPNPLSPVAKFQPGKGIKVTSYDGRFGISLSTRLQMLYALQRFTPGDDLSSSFLIRRARLVFKGHMFDPHIKFKMELAVSARDQGVDSSATGDETIRVPTQTPLLDGILEFTYLRDLNIKVGQYKVHFNRERVISSGKLQFVDRSLTNAEFNLDRDTGINLSSDALGGLEWLRYDLSLTSSDGRSVTDRQARPSGFSPMILTRWEVLPFGTFDDYIESDLKRHQSFKMSVGAAYAYIVRPYRERGVLGSVFDHEVKGSHHATADVMIKYRGWSVLTDGYWRQFVNDPTGRNGWGINAQTAYLMPGIPFELGLRYSMTRPKNDLATVPDRQEGTAVASWYFHEHAAKVQTDFTYRAARDRELDVFEQGWRLRVTTSFIF